MIPVDAKTMLEIAPRFSGANARRQAEIVAAVGEVLRPTLERYAIDTRLRIAHFLAQTCHESAGFRTTEEFADGSGYEGRADLGNTQPGDGPRYKGRGLMQLTGRANYRALGKTLNLPLETEPQRAAEPELSLVIACEYWKSRKINDAADQDDIVRVTKLINGGLNGLPDRRTLTTAAKAALARTEGLLVTGAQPEATHPTLTRGAGGEDVATLQRLLRGRGFPVAVDGDFGAATELAIVQFQTANGLGADGVVGAKTWAALEKAAK